MVSDTATRPLTDPTPEALCRPDPLLDRLESTGRRVVTERGGRCIHWRVWGQGSPVVCLHGGSGSWKHWVRNIEPLAGAHMVLVPDLPGFGASDDPEEPIQFLEIGRDVTAGIDQIVGADVDYAIAAFSFGGAVTCTILQVQPGRQKGIFLCGSAAFGKPNPPPSAKIRDKTGEELVEAHRANLAGIMLSDPGAIDPLALRIQHENTLGARLKTRAMDRGKLLPEVLEEYPGPLVALWGDLDAFLGPGMLEDRIETLRRVKPDAEIHVLRGVGHWANYEAAETVNGLLLDFLDRVG